MNFFKLIFLMKEFKINEKILKKRTSFTPIVGSEIF